jgi:UPF0755 protein
MPASRAARFLVRAAAFLCAFAAALAAAGAWWLLRPLPLPADPYLLDVKPGASIASIGRTLADDGVIAHRSLFTGWARFTGVDRQLKAGRYAIAAPVDLAGLVAKLERGDVLTASVTLVEGSTWAEAKAKIAAEPALAVALANKPDAEIARALGIDAPSLEGRFFPDTYVFAVGASDKSVLELAHRALNERLAAAWAKRAPDLPLASPEEALILASIVEKETGRAEDRPAIASVFVNRLKLGMRLQTDPTVIYGIGPSFDGNLRRRDLETDTPYNTYTRAGLPPTPIALPSQASIDAVLNPPPTPFLYFVARGDGSSEFSATLAEHNRAVAKYQLGRR